MEDERPKTTLQPSDTSGSHPTLKRSNVFVSGSYENTVALEAFLEKKLLQYAIAKAPAILENTLPARTAFPSGFWFEMLVPLTVSTDFLANLEEIFLQKWVPRYGIKKASILWHTQCGRMAVQHWFDKAMETATAIRKTIW